jgi:hypothetical protein
MRLRELYDRIEQCNDRYWELDKPYRKKVGLRPELAEIGYSGARVVEFSRELLSRAFRGLYPIDVGRSAMMIREGLPSVYDDIEAVIAVVESLTLDLEAKLDAAYAGLATPEI